MSTMPGPCSVSFRSVFVPRAALSQVRLDATHGGKTLAGHTLGPGSIVEHLHNHPAGVANLAAGGCGDTFNPRMSRRGGSSTRGESSPSRVREGWAYAACRTSQTSCRESDGFVDTGRCRACRSAARRARRRSDRRTVCLARQRDRRARAEGSGGTAGAARRGAALSAHHIDAAAQAARSNQPRNRSEA